eukprot:10259745-Alexandrium_andersonii.AAC.1
MADPTRTESTRCHPVQGATDPGHSAPRPGELHARWMLWPKVASSGHRPQGTTKPDMRAASCRRCARHSPTGHYVQAASGHLSRVESARRGGDS